MIPEFGIGALSIALGFILKRDSMLFFLLGFTLIMNGLYLTTFQYDGFYLFRIVTFSILLRVYITSGGRKPQAIILALCMVWFTLLAIEDYLFSLGYGFSLVYDNFEAVANALFIFHIIVSVDGAIAQRAGFSDNNSNNLSFTMGSKRCNTTT